MASALHHRGKSVKEQEEKVTAQMNAFLQSYFERAAKAMRIVSDQLATGDPEGARRIRSLSDTIVGGWDRSVRAGNRDALDALREMAAEPALDSEGKSQQAGQLNSMNDIKSEIRSAIDDLNNNFGWLRTQVLNPLKMRRKSGESALPQSQLSRMIAFVDAVESYVAMSNNATSRNPAARGYYGVASKPLKDIDQQFDVVVRYARSIDAESLLGEVSNLSRELAVVNALDRAQDEVKTRGVGLFGIKEFLSELTEASIAAYGLRIVTSAPPGNIHAATETERPRAIPDPAVTSVVNQVVVEEILRMYQSEIGSKILAEPDEAVALAGNLHYSPSGGVKRRPSEDEITKINRANIRLYVIIKSIEERYDDSVNAETKVALEKIQRAANRLVEMATSEWRGEDIRPVVHTIVLNRPDVSYTSIADALSEGRAIGEFINIFMTHAAESLQAHLGEQGVRTLARHVFNIHSLLRNEGGETPGSAEVPDPSSIPA